MGKRAQGLFQAYLMLTAFLTGGIVMLIEILGARIIAPFFGSSIFIWTSVISVTLLSLAVGYWYGGRVADRSPMPATLYSAILASGSYLFLVLFVKTWVLNLSSRLGLRLGALSSSLILFSPPLVLLGMVSPFTVKLYAKKMEDLGSHVGVLYALSTIGSFVGTLLTGFVLIPQYGVARIVMLTAGLLVAIPLIYFIVFQRDMRMLLIPLVVVAASLLLHGEGLSQAVIGDTRWKVLYTTDSFYGQLKVIEANGMDRYLIMDGTKQGGVNTKSGLSATLYAYVLEFLSDMACPDMSRVLIIGLGPGTIPNDFSKRGVTADVVEIDPKVIQLYRRYFADWGKGERIHIYAEDGRCFLKRRINRYDAVIMDVFLGDSAPWHLLTEEALSDAKGILTERGVLLINFVGLPQDPEDARMLAAIHKTLQEMFSHVFLFNGRGVIQEGAQNVFFLASFARPSFKFSSKIPVPAGFSDKLYRIVNDRQERPDRDTFILTDDYNPVEFYTARTKEWWRRAIMQSRERRIMLE
jgi:spermidine synthase